MTKYRNRKTVIDGYRFDSMREAARYQELRLLERAGVISELELQPKYTLQPGFTREGKKHRAITYTADFRYRDERGATIVEDVKGVQTQVFRMKRKMLLYVHGIDVLLT